MRKPNLVEGFALTMFCISLALTVGLSIYKGNIETAGIWWFAVCINAHSLISLARRGT